MSEDHPVKPLPTFAVAEIWSVPALVHWQLGIDVTELPHVDELVEGFVLPLPEGLATKEMAT